MICGTNWSDPKQDVKILLSRLWDIEFFDMWNINEAAAVAYVLEHAYQKYDIDSYRDMVDNLFLWATNTTWNQFAFEIAFATAMLLSRDISIDDIDRKRANQRYDKIVSDYNLRKATSFWLLDEKYAPAWFKEMWPSWIEIKEEQMKKRFIDAFDGMKWKDEDANVWYNRFKNQDVILLHELDQCLKRRKYKDNFALTYRTNDGGFVTAKDLSQEYGDMPMTGVYLTMFMMRG